MNDYFWAFLVRQLHCVQMVGSLEEIFQLVNRPSDSHDGWISEIVPLKNIFVLKNIWKPTKTSDWFIKEIQTKL